MRRFLRWWRWLCAGPAVSLELSKSIGLATGRIDLHDTQIQLLREEAAGQQARLSSLEEMAVKIHAYQEALRKETERFEEIRKSRDTLKARTMRDIRDFSKAEEQEWMNQS